LNLPQFFNNNLSELYDRYYKFVDRKMHLDISRSKPCQEQLDLSSELITCLNYRDCLASDGTDYRNYGIVDGIREAKKLFSQLLDMNEDEIIIGGNSSLNLMYDFIARAMTHGVPGINVPWMLSDKVKFICPSPGYDRHFAICKHFNIEMINVEIKDYGPDMDAVEELVANDESIKGIWCMPQYSNPTGTVYADEVVDRLAAMKTKACDFRIFWDNAYAVHHFSENPPVLKNILKACKDAGNPDRVVIFSTTSKITLPGAGVAMMAACKEIIEGIKVQLSMQTIGPDKINQLRHVRFLKNMDNIREHVKKHVKIIKPKFDMVLSVFERELDGKGMAWWNYPQGGYFIHLKTLKGCASEVVEMAARAGLVLGNPGTLFPYGVDPEDRHIRIAPTFPSVEELENAMELLCICIQIVTLKKYSDGTLLFNT
jgi:DNA-binding transcriptional MocR family regulator